MFAEEELMFFQNVGDCRVGIAGAGNPSSDPTNARSASVATCSSAIQIRKPLTKTGTVL